MPTLYVLENPRHRRKSRRRRNPSGQFAANPRRRSHRRRRNPDSALMANPRRRRSYRRNPISMEQVFGGYGVDDVALAAGAMVLIQKVQEMLPLNMRTGFADPISAAAVTGVGVMVLKGAEPKLARALGMGGGIATALKVVAQIPALNSFVSPGSLVIGRHVPMLSTPSIAPLPSGKVVASAPAPQVRL